MLRKSNTLIFFVFIMILLLKFQNSFGQDKIILDVLKKNKIGKTYCFNYTNKENGFEKISIVYLGNLKSNDKVLKILSWGRIWGKNRHTNGVVYVYDLNNYYLGNYYLGSNGDLPSKIEGSFLIFENKKKSDCDKQLITKIDFTKDIPEEIFLKCNGDNGDFYSFSKDK